MAETSTSTQVLVGRQPIVDLHGRVVAFELLYRPTDPARIAVDGDQMTVSVLLGALTIGVEQLVGDRYMFCNAERGVLVGETPLTLPPSRTVIEVLETVDIDDEIVEGCQALVEAGFRLALDDFVWVEGAERLLELASVVKVDLMACSRAEAVALVERCRPYGVRMLAEKVETPEDVEWAKANGFEYLQGYAIERPAIVRGQTVAPSALTRMQLATTMLSRELDFEEIEEVLRREPGLVVQMLEMASHGSHLGMRREVRTVREALVLVGSTRIRQWIALTILNSGPDISPDGLATALSRARMAELICRERGLADPDFAFVAGLISTLDLLLGVEAAELERTTTLDASLKAAAFARTGPVGQLLDEIAAYQVTATERDVPDELDTVAARAFAWAMPYLNRLGGRTSA